MSVTKPNVFIIESLDFKDEKNGHYEGEIISKILNFSGISHKYFYIRTKQEFEYVINLFKKSNYRYLHISCHGNTDALYTTLDEISFDEIGLILENVLDKRRIFISACAATNSKLADKIFSNTECYSLIGPAKNIKMDDAAIFWASFYQIMFKKNLNGMTRKSLEFTLKNLIEAFEVKIKYFSASKTKKNWIEVNL